MSDNSKNIEKGSLERAMSGDYSFNVSNAIKEGWNLTKSGSSALSLGVLFLFLVAMFVISVAQGIAAKNAIEITDPWFLMAAQLVVVVMTAPFTAALIMMGINSSIGGSNKFGHMFHFVNRTAILLIAILMTSILVELGLRLLLLPGLYLFVATGFVLPLILDKGMLPSRAIIISIKVVNFQWLNFIKLYLFFGLLVVLSLFTFGIALIWVLPFYYNVKGVLYRDIFGVGIEHQVAFPDSNQKMVPMLNKSSTGKAKEEFFDA